MESESCLLMPYSLSLFDKPSVSEVAITNMLTVYFQVR